jgi:hypothetical protein
MQHNTDIRLQQTLYWRYAEQLEAQEQSLSAELRLACGKPGTSQLQEEGEQVSCKVLVGTRKEFEHQLERCVSEAGDPQTRHVALADFQAQGISLQQAASQLSQELALAQHFLGSLEEEDVLTDLHETCYVPWLQEEKGAQHMHYEFQDIPCHDAPLKECILESLARLHNLLAERLGSLENGSQPSVSTSLITPHDVVAKVLDEFADNSQASSHMARRICRDRLCRELPAMSPAQVDALQQQCQQHAYYLQRRASLLRMFREDLARFRETSLRLMREGEERWMRAQATGDVGERARQEAQLETWRQQRTLSLCVEQYFANFAKAHQEIGQLEYATTELAKRQEQRRSIAQFAQKRGSTHAANDIAKDKSDIVSCVAKVAVCM